MKGPMGLIKPSRVIVGWGREGDVREVGRVRVSHEFLIVDICESYGQGTINSKGRKA